MITKYGDDIVDVISSLPESEKKEALELINTYGDDALSMIESNKSVKSVKYVELYCKAKNGNLNLSRKKIKHINVEHNPHKVAERLKYNEYKLRDDATYFNKGWSESMIEEAANFGYNEAVKRAIEVKEENFVYVFEYKGENVTVCLEKYMFKTAYGAYKYSLNELLELLGGE